MILLMDINSSTITSNTSIPINFSSIWSIKISKWSRMSRISSMTMQTTRLSQLSKTIQEIIHKHEKGTVQT